MTRRVACLILLLSAGTAFSQAPSDTFSDIRRVVAFGDIHGDYPRFVELLHTAGLVDSKNAWTGGATPLVLVGDFVDRGDHSAQVMDLLIDLEPQARKAGGQLHALIGNHEAMDLYGDLRYVTKEDFAGYASATKGGARRKNSEDEHPLGWAEQRQAFQPDGKYGKWLRQLNTI